MPTLRLSEEWLLNRTVDITLVENSTVLSSLLSLIISYHAMVHKTMLVVSEVCILQFPFIMPPVRTLSFGSWSWSSTIVLFASRSFLVMLTNGIQFTMCRLCSMNQTEEAAQQQAHLVAWAEEDEEDIWSGLTICVPPWTHCICALCRADYIVPLTRDQLDHCRPCQKSEKCLRCRKIKKNKCFHKENGTNTLYKMCSDCCRNATTCTFQKCLQAESQGMYMHSFAAEKLLSLLCWFLFAMP